MEKNFLSWLRIDVVSEPISTDRGPLVYIVFWILYHKGIGYSYELELFLGACLKSPSSSNNCDNGQ
jgi:hypothetical protein